MLHIKVDTAIAENKARGGEDCIVDTYFTTQWTYCLELWQKRRISLVVQVHRWWWDWHSSQRFDGLLILSRIPPLQELEEEDAHREASGEGESQGPQDFFPS